MVFGNFEEMFGDGKFACRYMSAVLTLILYIADIENDLLLDVSSV
jgi:hypothetical protein